MTESITLTSAGGRSLTLPANCWAIIEPRIWPADRRTVPAADVLKTLHRLWWAKNRRVLGPGRLADAHRVDEWVRDLPPGSVIKLHYMGE